MVAHQIFRAAVLVATAGAIAGAGPAAAQHPAVLVDLRAEPSPDGGELAEALAALPELALAREPELAAALAGL